MWLLMPLALGLIALLVVASTGCDNAASTTAVQPTVPKESVTATTPTGGDATTELPDDVTWVLNLLDGQPVLEETSITLEINADRLGGWDGCNSFASQPGDGTIVAQADGTFSIPKEIVSTARGCKEPEDALENQADAYMSALLEAARFRVVASRLEIFDTKGMVRLVFVEQPSIEAVLSRVPSKVGGDPLRPLFEHLPADSPVIARLASAIDEAIPIASDENLSANDRGRDLSVRYSDGSRLAVRQVSWCEPWSDADAKESVGGRCQGRWVPANDTWWVEGTGMVESSDLSRWWQDMAEFMAPIGSIGIPQAIKAGEPFKITLLNWDAVINGDSLNLSLVSSDGSEIGLGVFPTSDLFQGDATVPAHTPSGRYWLRVAGGGFYELVEIVEVSG